MTSKLIGLDFEIQFRPGLENKAAHALSWQIMYKAISIVQASMWDMIDSEVQADESLVHIIRSLEQGKGDFSVFLCTRADHSTRTVWHCIEPHLRFLFCWMNVTTQL